MSNLMIVLALAASIPNVDPGLICVPAREAALPQDKSGAFDSCVRDEQAARDELRQKWSRFSADARGVCAQPPGVTPSYVELLTCLEMQTGANFGSGKAIAPPITPPTPEPDAKP